MVHLTAALLVVFSMIILMTSRHILKWFFRGYMINLSSQNVDFRFCIHFFPCFMCLYTVYRQYIFFHSNDLFSHLAVAGPSGSSSVSKGTKSSLTTATKRSIQDMEDKSEAFKSLFTTHNSAKRSKDQISNWVTHTPYHF